MRLRAKSMTASGTMYLCVPSSEQNIISFLTTTIAHKQASISQLASERYRKQSHASFHRQSINIFQAPVQYTPTREVFSSILSIVRASSLSCLPTAASIPLFPSFFLFHQDHSLAHTKDFPNTPSCHKPIHSKYRIV